MSQLNKAQLLAMQANSLRTANRYKRYATYLETPEDQERLPYHNSEHMLAVTALAVTLCKMDSTKPSPALLLAAAAHDLGHLGRPDSYRDADGLGNIDHAVRMLESANMKFGLPKGTTEQDFEDAKVLIRATEYRLSPTILGCDPRLEYSIRILRDADILWGLFPENHTRVFVGLFLERLRNTPSEDLTEDDKSIEVALTNQIRFIQGYQPHSQPGRVLKRLLEEESAVAWSGQALEIMRQQELHRLITSRNSLIGDPQALIESVESNVDRFIAERDAAQEPVG